MVAFADPPDVEDVQALSGILGYEIVPVLGDPIAIDRILRAGQPAATSNGNGPASRPQRRPTCPTVRHPGRRAIGERIDVRHVAADHAHAPRRSSALCVERRGL